MLRSPVGKVFGKGFVERTVPIEHTKPVAFLDVFSAARLDELGLAGLRAAHHMPVGAVIEHSWIHHRLLSPSVVTPPATVGSAPSDSARSSILDAVGYDAR